ncbi:RNB domain-containing ribonuclease [Dermabacter vaginalis]|uniref:RNB domain-containing ribonuclease n=1 Tax=Dermabacter vaginalis TaxID=1630135 RepID=UPI001EF6F58A|nr:RNB domain-containing ribonuclease [Dermabacter vaginalis]MCG7442650.1 RNB domain-containing ribonuclease [Dermabacter vaginalis]
MPVQRLSMPGDRKKAPLDTLAARIDEALEKSDVDTDYPEAALAEAEHAARTWREHTAEHADLTSIEFVTLDPESSTDLDQALHIEREGEGYRVQYAIADVPLFVEPESALDGETRKRGLTLYLPDRRIPLHPVVLSEDEASLLPHKDTPAFVWDFTLDERARVTNVDLTRALVRNRQKLAYTEVQHALEKGEAGEVMQLLVEVGEKRAALEIERGGASLSSPEQEVVTDEDTVHLQWRLPEPIEEHNAQISLMTGMAAAKIMIEGKLGILRTMPPATPEAIDRFRAQAAALKEPWPQDQPYGEFLRTLDWRKGRHLALLDQATSLFRGAGYEAFDGILPEVLEQSAIAAPYAHTTAPLRRLVDRFVLHVCHSLITGAPLDERIRAALPELPSLMQGAQQRNSMLEKKAREIAEIGVLSTLVGTEFEGTVLDFRPETDGGSNPSNARPDRIEVQFSNPPVARWIDGARLPIGTRVTARLESVDEEKNWAEFTVVSSGRPGHGGEGQGPTSA